MYWHDVDVILGGADPERFPTLLTRPAPLDMTRFRLESGFAICVTGSTGLIPPYEFYGKIDVRTAVQTLRDCGQLWSEGHERTFEGATTDFIVEARDDLPQIAQGFSEPVRWHASARGMPAPIEVWNAYAADIIAKRIEMKFRGEVIVKLPMTPDQWNMSATSTDHAVAREYLWALTKMATHFKIGWAIGIMQILLMLQMSRPPIISILDPSAGWGDRLSAALILGLDDTSVDPNPALESCWERIIAAVGTTIEANAEICIEPFEEFVPRDSLGRFNIVFTSPPYRPDDERYTPAIGQAAAHITGDSRKSWEGWFREFVDSAWCNVAPGGCLAMHISNTRFCPAYDLLLSAMGRTPDKIIGARGNMLWTVPVWIKPLSG